MRTKLFALVAAALLALGAGGVAAGTAHTPIDGVSPNTYEETQTDENVEPVSVTPVEPDRPTIRFESNDDTEETHNFTSDEVRMVEMDDDMGQKVEKIPADEVQEMNVNDTEMDIESNDS